MNEILNKFLLVGDKFIPEMHLNNPVLLTVFVVYLPKTKKGDRKCKFYLQK